MTTQQVEDVIRTCHHADLVVDGGIGPDEDPELLGDGSHSPPVDQRVEDQLVATCAISALRDDNDVQQKLTI